MGLYIETRIRADLDELWTRTQEPAHHQRWDLRFTEIDYLPCAAGEPQHFRYATRVLPFLTVAGRGVSAGERRRPDGTRTSALRFASSHPLSPLAEGSGYWRYVPTGEGVRFLTGYDYRPHGGHLGRFADRLLFRPFMGWATAWSFDRLRLWLEHGISPERARWHWLAELAVRTLAVTAACAGLACGRRQAVARLLAPLPFHWTALLCVAAVVLALFAPPLPRTPAARRCRRTPPATARAPRLLDTPALPPLEQS